MSKLASEIIEQAKSWIGKKESDGSHKVIIDTYNSHKPLARGYKMKYTDAWCSCFVSACAIKKGMTDIIPSEVSCSKHIELFKKLGIWIEDDSYIPKTGDIILYDWKDDGIGENTDGASHIGYVEKVVNKDMTIIEGNLDNSVKRRNIKVNARYIRGYASPNYEKETTLKSVDEIAKEVIDGKWGDKKSNPTRKERLEKAGYNYKEVQDRVNELLKPNKDNKVYHVVKKGDTLWSIAKKYYGSGLKYPTIKKLNGLKSDIIYPGQKLVIK